MSHGEIVQRQRQHPGRLMAVAISALVGVLAWSGGASGAESAAPTGSEPAEPLQVAFVYLATIDPAEAWNEAHHVAQLAMEEHFGDQIEITTVENVPEGPASEQTFEDLARQGYDVIFGTTFGYMDQMHEVAQRYPDIKFLNAAGYLTADNMTNYFGAEEQARYLLGMIAGAMTESDKLGYVAAFPIPLVIRGINAFALGAQRVNPDATVNVVWTSSWFDPTGDKQAAQALIQQGVDVLSNETDSPGVGQAAEEAGNYWLGSYADQSSFAPNAWLASQCWDFGPYLIDQVEKIKAGTWASEAYWGDLANGLVKLCGPSSTVPADVVAQVADVQGQIIDGSVDIWDGPIVNQAGEQVVAEGETLPAADQETMNWFVQGVEGTIPQ
jgi:basic membrane protein A